MSANALLLLYALVAVVGLVVLVARFKIHSFIGLILASMFVGLCAGMEPVEVAKGIQLGLGNVLGSIALVIGLGTLLGNMLAESGGAQVIATRLVRFFGEKRMHWTLMLVGLIVGIPVFFAVGLVLLAPILFTLIRQTKKPVPFLGIPMLAGLSVAHGLIPPHPGPMAAIGLFNAGVLPVDVGKIILYSFVIGLPTAMVAGPMFAKWSSRHVRLELSGGIAEELARSSERSLPGLGVTLFTVLLPVLLMILTTLVDLVTPAGSTSRKWADFLGHPAVALLIGFLVSLYTFGFARGLNKEQILRSAGESLKPVGEILLVVGAGAGFSKVLELSGTGGAIAALAKGLPLSPLLLGWLVAALIRIATGSATVAISAAAGIMAPMVATQPGTNLELLIIAMGAGSLILSHVNDGGFWFVKSYFNMTVPQMLKTWTVMETIISIVALGFVFVLDALLRLL